jgi:hypothetical protein
MKRFLALIVTALLATASAAQADSIHPVDDAGTLRGGESRTYAATFYGGQPAIVAALGDGVGDLDVRVYDLSGRLVAEDIDLTSYCFVEWAPRLTGRYLIVVRNHGRLATDFAIRSN